MQGKLIRMEDLKKMIVINMQQLETHYIKKEKSQKY